jgi:hypothetical protein
MSTGKTQDDVRQLALSLREAVEAPHFDRASFRVRGKIFATLPPSTGPDDQRVVLMRLPPQIRESIRESDPHAWVSLGNWERGGAIQLAIDRIAWDRLADLVTLAWRNTAPKALRPAPGEGA